MSSLVEKGIVYSVSIQEYWDYSNKMYKSFMDITWQTKENYIKAIKAGDYPYSCCSRCGSFDINYFIKDKKDIWYSACSELCKETLVLTLI